MQSQLAEETFNLGITELDKGNVEVGQELAQDALNFYEQVFGSVHPEAASHYHTLGISAFYVLRRLEPSY